MTVYVPLWVKSNFSFLEGASHPHELVERAHALGLDTLALTDRDGVHGVVQAHLRARELGLRLIVGAEVTIVPDAFHQHTDVPGTPRSLVLLAQNRRGYGHLCQLLSKGRLSHDKGDCAVDLDTLSAFSEGLIALCPAPALLAPLRAAFADRLYALLTRHLHHEEDALEHALRTTAAALEVPLVASTTVLYHDAARQPLQDTLTCIRHGTTLAAAGRLLRPNNEHRLLTPHEMATRFADQPEALLQTRDIAARCTFSLDDLRYTYPVERAPAGSTPHQWLRDLARDGAQARYGTPVPDAVKKQLETELALIEELEYGGYFLTMREIVHFCRSNDILCQGRGSAANSVLCYVLGITAVDPIKLDLLFDRFLSRERAEPPDIDLDIEHQRREEVIQWVYRRYGRRHAAMVSVTIRYRTKSAIRDVGKVLGLAESAIESIVKHLGRRRHKTEAHDPHAELEAAGVDPTAVRMQHFLHLVSEIREFPRHLSIHPGGFLIGHEPVDTLVPIEPGAMAGRTVIQWDKYAVEGLGLFKVDLLGLGALSQLRRAFHLLKSTKGITLDMATIPAEDRDTYAMLSRGESVGVFQVESRAQMSMLPRLKPATFYDLVIQVAIIRPGPIQGDMVHPYLRRRRGEEPEEYPHPETRAILKKTLGVPIFQEQVMKLAVRIGGYTGGEADQLRRDMGAWKAQGKIAQHKARLLPRMLQNGLPLDYAERIFSQLQGFAEYGFPESHAASFALIAYATAWMKCHHPDAFLCALLNAQPMGFYAPSTLIEHAGRAGVEVRPIDVTRSQWLCTLEPAEGPHHAVRMGYKLVNGLGPDAEAALAAHPGPYTNLADFVRQTRLDERALSQLAKAGAFDELGENRRAALWNVKEAVHRLDDTLDLGSDARHPSQPRWKPLSTAAQIVLDYQASNHSTRGHPLAIVRHALWQQGLPDARTLNALPHDTRTRFAGLVICRQRPGTATGVTFLTLEDETDLVNVVVWSDIFAKHHLIARTAQLLGVRGKIQHEDGVTHLIAEDLWVPNVDPPAGPRSRDFH